MTSASNDLHHRLVAVEGASRRSAVKRFASHPRAHPLDGQWERDGHVSPRPQGGDNRSHRMEAFAAEVLNLVDETPDITLAEIAEYLEGTHGLRTSQSAVRRLLDRHGMTFKKTAHASERQRPDVPQRREAWFDRRPDLPPERLVFIDETGASIKMARMRGRAPRGQRCRAPVPHGHRKTTTFVGPFRLSGMTAPMVPHAAKNGRLFSRVEQALVPTLSPGDVVIIDNLPTHKPVAVERPLRPPGRNSCSRLPIRGF